MSTWKTLHSLRLRQTYEHIYRPVVFVHYSVIYNNYNAIAAPRCTVHNVFLITRLSTISVLPVLSEY